MTLISNFLSHSFAFTQAHMDDIIHGITPNTNGAKYMLIVKHHFNRPDKQGVVRLSKDLVEEAVANRRA